VDLVNVKSELRAKRQGSCTALLKAEMDLAFLYLRLAETESELGANAVAADLLEGAILTHKKVTRHLQYLPSGMDGIKPELQSGASALLDAIVATEHELQVLQLPPRGIRRDPEVPLTPFV
jgi:hypothetical protein